MTILDTSALVRFFAKDDPAKAEKVKILLTSEEDLYLPDAVFVELQYVLLKVYKTSREDIVRAFRFLVAVSHLRVTAQARDAVELFGRSTLSFADCLVGMHAQGNKLASFDEKLIKTAKSDAYWK